MVRPLKADREAVCKTSIRISHKTLQMLKDLQERHRFKTLDNVLQYYLTDNVITSRPHFHSAKEVKDLTYQEPVNSIIKDVSGRIAQRSRSNTYHQSVKSYSGKHSKSKPVHKRQLWAATEQHKF